MTSTLTQQANPPTLRLCKLYFGTGLIKGDCWNRCSTRILAYELANTPMARLRTPSTLVAAAINVRTEGLGVRATGRSFGKSHSTIIRWEQRLARHLEQWSPPAPDGADITLEGDEVYTRVGENLSPL